MKWQTEMLAYQKVIEIALHHLPPGHAITIENLLPVPEDYAKRASYYIDMGPDQLLYDISHGLTSHLTARAVHRASHWLVHACFYEMDHSILWKNKGACCPPMGLTL